MTVKRWQLVGSVMVGAAIGAVLHTVLDPRRLFWVAMLLLLVIAGCAYELWRRLSRRH